MIFMFGVFLFNFILIIFFGNVFEWEVNLFIFFRVLLYDMYFELELYDLYEIWEFIVMIEFGFFVVKFLVGFLLVFNNLYKILRKKK